MVGGGVGEGAGGAVLHKGVGWRVVCHGYNVWVDEADWIQRPVDFIFDFYLLLLLLYIYIWEICADFHPFFFLSVTGICLMK